MKRAAAAPSALTLALVLLAVADGVVVGQSSAVAATGAAPAGDTAETKPGTSRSGGFTIESLSPLTQSTRDLFGVNCFIFLLTNTGPEADSYHMDAENLSPPTWAAAVQVLGQVTYPYPAVHPLAAGESDALCAEFTPFHDGVGSYDFVIHSASDPGEVVSFHLTLYAGTAAVGVEAVSGVPSAGLHSNYPNPFSRETQFHYDLERSAHVDLRIYDAAGRLVRVLKGGTREAGRHTARWDGVDELGRPASAGAYFYQLTTGDTRSTRRMVLLR